MNRLLNPQQVLGSKRREQTVEEGACTRQVAGRPWALGKSSRLGMTGMGGRWRFATDETGEIAALQAEAGAEWPPVLW